MTKPMLLLILLVELNSHHVLAQDTVRVSTKALMSVDQFRATGLDKLSPAELVALETWISKLVATATIAGAPPSRPPADASALTIEQLEGSMIIAEDGEPLGRITTNCLASDALCNEFGRYGNEFNSKSIFNQFGAYGNEFSQKSPFNQFTRTPPKIYKDGKVVAVLSRNASLTPRVEPRWLIGMLKSKR